ncbi:MAG: osmoprotectant transport system substrate-binding protein [Thermoleophilaceae bacterium]|jgi:osmoprotectant transport system substrate-binding protein|nr:osmoprotectant transport system substrate-binding protein [Thermoleophilaceae bacterium]
MSVSRRGFLGAAALITTASLALAGCSSSNSLSGSGSSSSATTSTSSGGGSGGTAITVGSANFPENVILAYVYGGALAKAGYTVSYKVNIGARAAYIASLKKGDINLVPEYAGSILSFLDKTANAKSGDAVKTALDAALTKEQLKAAEFSQAADSDALNVTPAYAKKNSLSSIADLKKVGSFTLAANPEFASRPDGIPGLKSVYGLNNVKFKSINDSGGNTTLKALLGNQVQVADIYSTTPSILANKLVSLKDPKNLFASQQVVPIYTASKDSSKLTDALNKVSQALTTQDLLSLNTKVTGDTKEDPQQAAKEWLSSKGLG